MKISIIILSLMLISCAAEWEEIMYKNQHLTCTPHDAVGCTGFYGNQIEE